MKRLFTFLMVIMTLFSNIAIHSQSLDGTTAWFNGENFDSHAVNDVADAWNFIAGNGSASSSMYYAYKNPAAGNLGNASGNVLAIANPSYTATTFAEPNANRQFEISKTFANNLTGYVYATYSGYTCTRGTAYTFLNSSGNAVFGVSGQNTIATLRYQLAKPTSDGTYLTGTYTAFSPSTGNLRGNWFQVEMLLNLTGSTKEVVKIKTTVGATVQTYGPITLTNGENISTFHIITGKYNAAGLDNVSIGNLLANNISNLTGAAQVQTTSSQIDETYSVTALGSVSSLGVTNIEIAGGNSDINWSISDYGTLTESDKSLVSINRNTSNHAQAVLTTTGAVSADATITLQAVLGSTTLTYNVTLKAASVAGLKELLLAEINNAKAKRDAVTDINPYIVSAKTTLQSQIDAAQAVYDNPAATEANVNNSIATLQGSETDFDNNMNPYNTYVSYIGTIQTAHDAETRTAPFFTAIKGTLSSSITNANNARTTITSIGDINSAKSDLETAKTQYDTDHPAFDNLQTQINNIVARLAIIEPRQGASFLMYPVTNVNALKTSKTNAEIVRDNGTTSVELNNANISLAADLVTYGEPRNAPSTTDYYKIYTYGVDAGDGNEVKKVVYDDGGILKYSDNESLIDKSQKLWYLQEVSQNVYTIQLLMTGTYLNGNTTSTTISNFTLPEGKSQTGLIYKDAGYFLYNIKNSGNRYLEVDTWDTGTSTGVFYNSTITADRLRFNYQFEPVDILSEINSADFSSRIYPTLTRDIVNVEGNVTTIDVFSLTGQKVNSVVANDTKTVVNMSNLSNGAYIIRATMEDGSANMQNVILQK